MANKAPISHTHDDRYYTETEINSKINTINNNISTINTNINSLSSRVNSNTINVNGYTVSNSVGLKTAPSDGYMGIEMDYNATDCYARLYKNNSSGTSRMILQISYPSDTVEGRNIASVFVHKGTTLYYDTNNTSKCRYQFIPLA